MRDPLSVLTTPDQPVEPRPRFAADLKQRLQEAAMTDQQTETTDSVTASTGGVSNLFYFTLPAPDLEQSKAFYHEVLGWEVDGGSLGGHIGNVTPVGGLFPGGALETQTVYITIDDIDAAAAKVLELGGTVEGEIERYESGAAVSCRDDQGTQFTLQAPGEGEYADYARSPVKGSNHGDLFYFSLPVADGERGKRFYSALFGWEFGAPGSEGGMNASNMITEGGLGAGRDGDRVEMWFRVDDIAAAVDKVRQLGGTADDPFDTPQGLIAGCVDNQGVEFGLAEPAAGY